MAGSQYFPEFFRQGMLSWGLYGVTAVGAPLTVVLAIRYAMNSGGRLAACFLILAGSLPFCMHVARHGLAVEGVDQWSFSMQKILHFPNPSGAHRLEFARGEEAEEDEIGEEHEVDLAADAEARRMIAGFVFQESGMKPMWLNGSGELEAFEPTEAEILEREVNLEMEKELRKSVRLLRKATRQHRKFFALHLLSFFAVLLPGLWVVIWRNGKKSV